MKYSFTYLQTNSESGTMNRVIMFWSSTITIFLNVEAIMLAMAYACSRIIDSLIAFASPLQLMTLEAF
jgi:hypothetical protein